jgi:predicted Fe-S protein YdhL (DUF1289 family)
MTRERRTDADFGLFAKSGAPPVMIRTPCVKVCVIETGSGLCSGCGRTLGEIARWGSMSEDERAAIMRALPARLAARAAASPPQR